MNAAGDGRNCTEESVRNRVSRDKGKGHPGNSLYLSIQAGVSLERIAGLFTASHLMKWCAVGESPLLMQVTVI